MVDIRKQLEDHLEIINERLKPNNYKYVSPQENALLYIAKSQTLQALQKYESFNKPPIQKRPLGEIHNG